MPEQSINGSSNRAFSTPMRDGWCQACRKIYFNQIFHPSRRSRQKRYALSNPLVPSCPMCRFIRQLEELDHRSLDEEGDDAAVSTGLPSLTLSTFDTHEPWWHVLALTTTRPLPSFAWFQREGSANAFESEKPLVLVTCTEDEPADDMVDVSVPRRRPTIEQHLGLIDLNIARDWLQICEQKHGASCRIDTGTKNPSGLRLIDVNTREIIVPNAMVRYVALSYVWGNRSKSSHGHLPTSSTSDLSGLAEASSLRQIPRKLPATLEDAITVCQALGESYLWIDLFCIDQSDQKELQGQINQMNKIYQGATFTIIARGSVDAYEGLAGISRPLRKREQPTCSTPHGELMATHIRPAIAYSGKSPWDLRAWTLQESLFSHRRLAFSNHTVRMICQREYFHDALVNTLAQRNPITLTNRFDWWDDDNSIDLTLSCWDFKTFNALVSIYTNRILRYPSDILNACRGALSELELRTGAQFSYGIPVTDAHRALLWTPHFSHTVSRRPGNWPSWSWCGWMGRTEWRRWIVDIPEYEGEADINDRYASILNRKGDKRRRVDGRSSPRNETQTVGSLPSAILHFPKSENPQMPPVLHTTTFTAQCTLVKAPTDTVEPSMLTYADEETGTATKKDLASHWTILSPNTTSSQGHPALLKDVANTTGEPDLFTEGDHFLRLSKEESGLLEKYAIVSSTNPPTKRGRASARGKGKQEVRHVPAELVLIKHWDLIRDSEDHDAWLADMVGCLVVVPDKMEGYAGDAQVRYRRIGVVMLEREVFESFGPTKGESYLV